MYHFPVRGVSIRREFGLCPNFRAVRGASVATPIPIQANHISKFTCIKRYTALGVFGKPSTSRSFQAARASRGYVRPGKSNFLPFTDEAFIVIDFAEEEARRFGHFVGTEQLLLGLIGADTGIAAIVLKSMGVNLEIARQKVERIIGRGAVLPRNAAWVPVTLRAQDVLDRSFEEARELGTWDPLLLILNL